MEDYAARVGLAIVSKLAIPVFGWMGSKLLGPLGARPVSPEKFLVFVAAGYGVTTYVAIQPEKSLDRLLGGVATVANTTGQVLGVVANQIRNLEKVDLEDVLNKPVQWLDPYFRDPEGGSIGSEGGSEGDSKNPKGDSSGPLLIAPLLPKDYTVDLFPYYLKPGTELQFIGDEDVDRYITAYYALGINIIPMILDNRQLPQIGLVRDIYLRQIRQVHPDKNPNVDAVRLSSTLNDAFATIRTLMHSPDAQLDLIQPVLQHFHKGTFSPLPYLLLFFAGGFITILLLR